MNATSTVVIQSVTKQILVSEENEARYLGACSHECAAHERNRYVKKHNISDVEKARRLENFNALVNQ
ncbi:sulfurtransferase [Staphylococcus gallinarum]|uniref:Sulfurtransferase n=1 Tax=Staphylococcus gallinarum TaxID=1293 RepID=A0A380FBW5_STAGA|nr:sulfurtransferase [Staphylococcus gallinarum]